MTATIQKWGIGFALRTPPAIAKQIQVKEGDPITLRVGASGLTVKAAPKKLSIDELLSQVTTENLHPATAWGADVGREILPPLKMKLPAVCSSSSALWSCSRPLT